MKCDPRIGTGAADAGGALPDLASGFARLTVRVGSSDAVRGGSVACGAREP